LSINPVTANLSWPILSCRIVHGGGSEEVDSAIHFLL
jgi:hypothetical protein